MADNPMPDENDEITNSFFDSMNAMFNAFFDGNGPSDSSNRITIISGIPSSKKEDYEVIDRKNEIIFIFYLPSEIKTKDINIEINSEKIPTLNIQINSSLKKIERTVPLNNTFAFVLKGFKINNGILEIKIEKKEK